MQGMDFHSLNGGKTRNTKSRKIMHYLCRALAGITKWGIILDQETLNWDYTVNDKIVHCVSCCHPSVDNHTSWYLQWVHKETAKIYLMKKNHGLVNH
jgi:hypothetical protein